MRCNRIARVLDLCPTHAIKVADALVAEMVKAEARCLATLPMFWNPPGLKMPERRKCSDVLHAAHLIPRQYKATRWLLANVVPLCKGHHRWFDTHPIEARIIVEHWLGEATVKELERMALLDNYQPELERALRNLRRAA